MSTGLVEDREDGRTEAELASGAVIDAARVPALGHAEAAAMATVELDRFLALLERLAPDDWAKPTVCTDWDVREVTAHVAGAAASYARPSEFARQWSPLAQRPYRRAGLGILDALNQIQVDDRATHDPAAVIAELRADGPRAIATRRRLPALARSIRLPMPTLGFVPIGYLTDLIYTRDMWVHRLDLSRATGQPMALTPDHDGRVIALVVRDLALKLAPRLRSKSVNYDLVGPAGGAFRFGAGPVVQATIRLDALDFAWLAAGRLTPVAAMTLAEIEGDDGLAGRILAATSVPF
jgi:uncharacterized protein (TIGR03083 family)